MTTPDKKAILTPTQVRQKIRRIAYEVYERNVDEASLVLAGIDGQGYVLARQLAEQLRSVSALEVRLVRISLDKTEPKRQPVRFDCPPDQLENRVLVVCDDVLNTARTLAYSLSPFFGIVPKKLQVAVLVDRGGHRRYPISADYVGYALSTTLNEHVEVILEGEDFGVYLH
jgi:pyrimidine operon attenuation protein/uracil phosphoribosyltransferase